MTRQAKAAVLSGPGVPLEVRSFDIPTIKDDSALIRVIRAGVCGTDVHAWKNPVVRQYPFIPGHEVIGEIEELGERVSVDAVGNTVEPGDRVFYPVTFPCGRCFFCQVAKDFSQCTNLRFPSGCKEYPYLHGGFSEYIVTQLPTTFLKVSKEADPENLIACACGGRTVIWGLELIGGFKIGEKVVIQGCGPVGLFSLIMAKSCGASEVLVIGAPDFRLKVAERLGADHTINIQEIPDPDDRLALVKEFLGPNGPDLCIEASGSPSAVIEGIDITRPAGRYLILGVFTPVGQVDFDPSVIVRKNLMIRGAKFGHIGTIQKAMSFIEQTSDKYAYKDLITHRFPLERATDALLAVEQLKAVKTVIVP